MPWLSDLSKELLVKVLDLTSDVSVLELAAASRDLKSAVEDCRAMGSEDPWRHPPGPWEASGLWRLLGLGDLKMIPQVSLCCQAEFQSVAEVLGFLKAAKCIAALTTGPVTFAEFSFAVADVADLFPCEEVEDDPRWCEAEQKVEVEYNGHQIQCGLVATRTWSDVTKPRTLCLDIGHRGRRMRKKPSVICTSHLTPDLRLQSSHGSIEIYADLRRGSPLAELMHKCLPLPLLLGVRG
eukprot:Skav219166  [mRNA]  locus=scaffold648:282183:283261:- [translate_table: standard]